MQRVLVTGASGFIGRHLCQTLRANGYTVRAVVRTPHNSTADEVVIVNDIDGNTEWSSAVADVHFVVHLAAHVHQLGSVGANAADFERVNAEGTRALAEAVAKADSIHRMVFISSLAAVASETSSVVDDASVCNPTSAYGVSKFLAEEHIARILAQGTPDWCVLRPALVYGRGNPGNLRRLERLIGKNIPLPFGSIRNARSFVYVGNLVDLIIRTLQHPAASRQRFVVADEPPLSTPSLIRLIADARGSRAMLLPIPLSFLYGLGLIADSINKLRGHASTVAESLNRLSSSYIADASGVKQALQWTPPYDVERAMSMTFSRASH